MAICTNPALYGVLEQLEATHQTIYGSTRMVKHPAIKQFKRLKHLAVVLIQKAARNVHAIVGVDANPAGVEGCVMELRQRQSIRHNGSSHPLVGVGNDLRGVEQPLSMAW